MKTSFQKTILTLALFVSAHAQLHAQGTAFTYQGRLNSNGNPAAGNFDMAFAVWDANTNGNQFGGALTNSATAVTNGLFTVTLDFGAGIFTGPARWLEIAARTNGNGAFTTLAPRQALTPTPYAIFAGTASNVSGTISSAQLGGGFVGSSFQFTNGRNIFVGDGGGLSGVNANSLNGLQAGNFWQTTGNAGTSPANGNFLGTTDNQPLELRANNSRALRLEPGGALGAPNVIGGAAANYVANGAFGATIGGGGATNYFGSVFSNSVTATFGTVGGGQRNTASGFSSTVGGGEANTSGTYYSMVGGGSGNTASGNFATVAGGEGNWANAPGVFIGGGGNDGVTISGNRADAAASAIGGGIANFIQTNANYSVIGGGQGNTINSFLTVISGGQANSVQLGADAAVIAGGSANLIGKNSFYGVIGGGDANTISTNSPGATISGGNHNVMTNASSSTIGGGSFNQCQGYTATVPGGWGNAALADYSFAAGNQAQANHQGAFVWADSQGAAFSSTAPNQFLIRAQGGVGINTNDPSGAALNVNGKITSPQWKASSIIATSGPLPKTGNITTSGGTLLIFISGSGYSTPGNAFIGMDLKIDGSAYTSSTIYANPALTHMAFVPNMVVRAGLAAGVHTLSLAARSGTTTDASDSFIVTVQELPF